MVSGFAWKAPSGDTGAAALFERVQKLAGKCERTGIRGRSVIPAHECEKKSELGIFR